MLLNQHIQHLLLLQFKTRDAMSTNSSKATVSRCLRLSALMAMLSGACGTAEELPSSYDLEKKWELFRATVHRESIMNGVYIVEGDIPITDEAALRNYFFTHVSEASHLTQSLTVRRVFGADVVWGDNNKFDLTYCVNDSFGTRKNAVIDGLGSASNSWSDLIGVRFRYMPSEDANCTAANTGVVFDVNPVDDTYFARAFFPDTPRAQRNLLITDRAFTTTDGGRDFQGILRHELGHALGFRHEQIWTERCASASDPTSDDRMVTDYDSDSVMHYPQCRPVNAGGYRQTLRDYHGAISLYGLAPPLIVKSTGIL